MKVRCHPGVRVAHFQELLLLAGAFGRVASAGTLRSSEAAGSRTADVKNSPDDERRVVLRSAR